MISYKHNLGDSISGDSITGQAGSIYTRGIENERGIRLKKLELFKSAVCVTNPPITISRKPATKNFILEGLKGHKIIGTSKKHSKIEKVKKTGRHTQQQITLRGKAKCVITIPITSKRSS